MLSLLELQLVAGQVLPVILDDQLWHLAELTVS
jgi:hypothetical protein